MKAIQQLIDHFAGAFTEAEIQKLETIGFRTGEEEIVWYDDEYDYYAPYAEDCLEPLTEQFQTPRWEMVQEELENQPPRKRHDSGQRGTSRARWWREYHGRQRDARNRKNTAS